MANAIPSTAPTVVPGRRAVPVGVTLAGDEVALDYPAVVRVSRRALLDALKPTDDGVLVDRAWVVTVLPNTATYGRRGEHSGAFGTVSWETAAYDSGEFTAWLNGALLPLAGMSRGRFRRLLEALGIDAKG